MLFAWSAITGFREGSMSYKAFVEVRRDSNPVGFWLLLGTNALFALALLVAGVATLLDPGLLKKP
jgi:hypothetical protein